MQTVLPSPTTWTIPSTPVPEHVRQFIVANYGISPEADMYIKYNEPNKVYMFHSGFLQYVDFSSPSLASPTIINDLTKNAVLNSQPVFRFEENVSTYRYAPVGYSSAVAQPAAESAETVQSSVEIETLCNRQVETEQFSGVAKQPRGQSPDTSVLQLMSELPEVNSAEWHKLTDSERELIQRERRKANAFKTALCQSFKESGTCEYGIDCRFAHGEDELRLPPQAHPKYKTQLCNKFSVSGYCPYGSRCQFIHQRPNDVFGQKEALLVQRNLSNSGQYGLTSKHRESGSVKIEDNLSENRGVRNELPSRMSEKENISAGGCRLEKKKTKACHSNRSETVTKSVSSCAKNCESKCHDESDVKTQIIRPESRVSFKKEQTEVTPSQQQSSIAEILDTFFLGDTDIEFSQSCFPRLSLSPKWITTVKSK